MSGYADRYFYPGTATLINHFGIKDPEELERVEAFYSRLALRQPILPAIEFTPDGLKQIHHHLFHQIYPWAGEFLTVDMVKLREPGQPPVRFAPGARVARVEIPRFFGELRYDMEVGRSFERLDRKTFGYRAAVYMADLNQIRRFRKAMAGPSVSCSTIWRRVRAFAFTTDGSSATPGWRRRSIPSARTRAAASSGHMRR